MAASQWWRLGLALGLPALGVAAYGCSLVGGISAPLPLHCTNGILDDGEKGIDCGGSCAKCSGAACEKSDECASELCNPKTGKCTTASDPEVCFPGQMTFGCQFCHSCMVNQTCVFDQDCMTGLCLNGSCASCNPTSEGPACTGVDGGPGGACTLVPSMGGMTPVCLGVTCFNGVMDNDETGIDCGGSCSKPCTPVCTGSACSDAGTDAGEDAGTDAGEDAGFDAGMDLDAGSDAGPGIDAGSDAGPGIDSGSLDVDSGLDSGSDGLDSGVDPPDVISIP
jgi:hypothetical protein